MKNRTNRTLRKLSACVGIPSRWITFLLIAFALFLGSFGIAYLCGSESMAQTPPGMPATPQAPTRTQEPIPSQQELDMERKQQREHRKAEYEKTKKMADELLKKAQELKTNIDKAGEDTLPLDAIREAEQIESLAKKIKSRVKSGS